MLQVNRLINLALGIFIINAGVVFADSSGGFDLRAGIGYDYVSQEYFLESDSSYLSPDSSLKSALLKKDYLDDKKGFLFFGYSSDTEKQNNLRQNYEIGWEQTDELFRILGSARIDKKWQKSRLEGSFRLETKENYRGDADPGEELTIINGHLNYRFQLLNRADLSTRIYAESVNFDTVETYIYNYSRYGIELGCGLFTNNFNSITLNSAVEIRDVPDSSQLDYMLYRVNLGYFGTFMGAYLTADFGLEKRNYNHSDNRDDYLLLNLNSDTRLSFGNNYFITFKQNAEYFNFSQDDFLNDDYFLAQFGLFVGRNFGKNSAFSSFLGPKIELLNIASDYSNDDDYAEIMAVLGVDYFGAASYSDGLFLMIENNFGKRIYRNYSDYRSEFLFDRLNIIGSAAVIFGLNFDILLSFDLEFHENSNDNSRLYLVSTGLSYQF